MSMDPTKLFLPPAGQPITGPRSQDFFGMLSGIGDSVLASQERVKLAATEQALKEAFPNGLPRRGDGSIDEAAVADVHAKLGLPGSTKDYANMAGTSTRHMQDLNFRKSESGRAQGNADRSFGLSLEQLQLQRAADARADQEFKRKSSLPVTLDVNTADGRRVTRMVGPDGSFSDAPSAGVPAAPPQTPSFDVIGKDQNGNDVKGFVDPSTRTVDPVSAKGIVAPGEATNANLIGDEYLKTLDPGRAAQVKAIVEGRMSPPGGFALKSPQVQALMRDAAQYEPGFDLNVWSQRNNTTKDFASGKSAQNVTSLNTVIGHMGDLRKAMDGLDNVNSGFGPLNTTVNAVKNYYNEKSGSAEPKTYELASKAVADEMAKVFRQTGMSDTEIRQWHSTLSPNMTKDQQKAVLAQGLSLLDSRLQALADQRNRGMAKSVEPRALLNEKGQKTLAEIEAWAKGEKPAPTGQPAPTKKLGDVQIPVVAARALQSDPTLREQFDAKYGLGASDRVLGPSR